MKLLIILSFALVSLVGSHSFGQERFRRVAITFDEDALNKKPARRTPQQVAELDARTRHAVRMANIDKQNLPEL